MLDNCVVEGSQFLARSVFEARGFHDSTYVRLMDHTWTIVSRLKTFDCFLVMLSGLCKPLNGTLSGFVFEGILQVDHLFSSGEVRSLVDRCTKLLPEGLPLQDVSVKARYF